MKPLKVVSDFAPGGDQPQAIEKLSANLKAGMKFQTLLGVTGSGKTYTMAKIIPNFRLCRYGAIRIIKAN